MKSDQITENVQMRYLTLFATLPKYLYHKSFAA